MRSSGYDGVRPLIAMLLSAFREAQLPIIHVVRIYAKTVRVNAWTAQIAAIERRQPITVDLKALKAQVALLQMARPFAEASRARA
jgi:hypothetical protein